MSGRKDWPWPEDSKTRKDAFTEYQTPVNREPLSDQQVADAFGCTEPKAHRMVEDVTETRSTDLGESEDRS